MSDISRALHPQAHALLEIVARREVPDRRSLTPTQVRAMTSLDREFAVRQHRWRPLKTSRLRSTVARSQCGCRPNDGLADAIFDLAPRRWLGRR